MPPIGLLPVWQLVIFGDCFEQRLYVCHQPGLAPLQVVHIVDHTLVRLGASGAGQPICSSHQWGLQGLRAQESGVHA